MSRHSLAILEWEDLRFPASAVNPPGLASDPGLDPDTGCYLFDAAATELLFFQVQLPHAWAEGTDLKPHVHWQKTTSASGNVLWRLEYKWAPIGEVMDAAFTTLDVTAPVGGTPDGNTADQHLISAFGTISAAGKQVSDMLICKVSRIGGNASDTYGADARFLEFDIHHQVNALGSDQEYSRANNHR